MGTSWGVQFWSAIPVRISYIPVCCLAASFFGMTGCACGRETQKAKPSTPAGIGWYGAQHVLSPACMLLVLEATSAGPQQLSWAASQSLQLQPREAVLECDLDGMGLRLWTSV